jgi:hypothetical protein
MLLYTKSYIVQAKVKTLEEIFHYTISLAKNLITHFKQCQRGDGGREKLVKLPGPGVWEGGPGPEYVTYVLILSLSAQLWEPEKIVLLSMYDNDYM